jgi:hypothetical protein
MLREDRIMVALVDNPHLFTRIEQCVLNAKTELAKRRLVQMAVTLGRYSAASEMIGEAFGIL